MSPSAVLGPVDPQIGEYPAASIWAALERKDPNELDDKTLILVDISRKAQRQVRDFVAELLRKQFSDERAAELGTALSEGRWTHDFPIDVKLCHELGLKVSTELPTRAASSCDSIRSPGADVLRWSTSRFPFDTPRAARHPERGPRSTGHDGRSGTVAATRRRMAAGAAGQT